MTSSLLRRTSIIGGAALGLALLPLGGAGAWAGYLQASGNIHEVEAGRIYRSKQLDEQQLGKLIEERGIRTVINLRGADSSAEWYRQEKTVVTEHGAELIDLSLSDTVEPDSSLMARLVDALRTATLPVLIHCKAGADRTGLASALYEFVVMGRPASEAAGQLSFAYGHFPWLGSRSSAMDRAYWDYVSATVAGEPS